MTGSTCLFGNDLFVVDKVWQPHKLLSVSSTSRTSASFCNLSEQAFCINLVNIALLSCPWCIVLGFLATARILAQMDACVAIPHT